MKPEESLDVSPGEFRKRKRETVIVVGLGIVFLLLVWFEIHLFGISQTLPLVHSVFFFGLVNFNIIILLLLLFLLFRNIVKAFAEKEGRLFGRSLKSKLVVSFLSFTLVPTLLMFLVSVFYINSSFDKWFGQKIAGVLRSSIEVTNEFYSNTKKRNYHYASEIAGKVAKLTQPEDIRRALKQMRDEFRLDAVEFYDGASGFRVLAADQEGRRGSFPPVNQEFLDKGADERVEASTIQSFGEGNLVRVVVPAGGRESRAVIVVSTLIPLSLLSKMDDVATAYEEFRDLNPLEYPIKSIYLVILVLMTLLILFCASWVGFYLAKQLTVPLELLGKATRSISRHKFDRVNAVSGSGEINELIVHFNHMTEELEKSEKALRDANIHLQQAIESLDEQNRYVEVVLSNVNTGVIAVDHGGNIQKMNFHAGQLLGIDPAQVVGRPAKEILSKEHYRTFIELLKSMKQHRATTLQKEFRLKIAGRMIPLQMHLSLLKDEKGQDLGQVIVFDDLSMLVNAQRAAAWREVARRIAHEIKNPLTPIKLSAQRLQKKFGGSVSDPAFASATSMIINEVDGLKRLVNEFSNFARMPEVQLTFGSLNKVVEDTVNFYQLSHQGCRFTLRLDADLPEMEFDPEQIKRVLNNLLDNAVAATEGQDDRRIAVETRFEAMVKIARITIDDNGPRVSDEVMERFFEPYFSTKENGTGLGLPIVKRIVEDHNGFVRANRLQPSGTQILLELPVVAERPARRESGAAEETAGAASEERS